MAPRSPQDRQGVAFCIGFGSFGVNFGIKFGIVVEPFGIIWSCAAEVACAALGPSDQSIRADFEGGCTGGPRTGDSPDASACDPCGIGPRSQGVSGISYY